MIVILFLCVLNRKIDMTHLFIQQFSDSQRTELYVVTEAFELMEPLVIKKTIQGGGNVQISAVEMFGIQVCGNGQVGRCSQPCNCLS